MVVFNGKKYGKCNQNTSIDIISPLSVWAMTNYAKPPFCFFFGGVQPLLNVVALPYIPGGVIIPFLERPSLEFQALHRLRRLRVRYWSSNRCTMGDACNFAHSDTELREQPDLVPRFVGRLGKFCPLEAWMSGWKLGSNGSDQWGYNLQLKYIQFF